MNLHKAFNVGLKNGVVGIFKEWKKEVEFVKNPPPDSVHRIRLSLKFLPTFELVNSRVANTLGEKMDHPRHVDDTVYERQVNSFILMLSVCSDIINNQNQDALNSSVYLTYSGDVYHSNYFTLEVCNKDGKQIISSSSIHNLIPY